MGSHLPGTGPPWGSPEVCVYIAALPGGQGLREGQAAAGRGTRPVLGPHPARWSPLLQPGEPLGEGTLPSGSFSLEVSCSVPAEP